MQVPLCRELYLEGQARVQQVQLDSWLIIPKSLRDLPLSSPSSFYLGILRHSHTWSLPWTCYLAKDNLHILTPLSPASKCWDYGSNLISLAGGKSTKSKAFHMPGKLYTTEPHPFLEDSFWESSGFQSLISRVKTVNGRSLGRLKRNMSFIFLIRENSTMEQ